MVLEFLPLVGAILLVSPLVVAQFDDRTDRVLTRVAVTFFGQYVARESEQKTNQQRRMRAAHRGDTHRSFAAQTLLIATVLAVFGGVVGVYVIGGVLVALEVTGSQLAPQLPSALSFVADFDTARDLGVAQLFPLLLVSSATFGTLFGVGSYYLRWLLLDNAAYARAGKIEATLPRTVAFIYALSRSGMSFPKVMNTLAENEDVYGAAARELGVAVREMETLGADPLTAMDRLSERTPSDNMSEFAGNLSSVLGSGRNLSEFLNNQYHRFQEEAESQQEQYLEILSTMAEAYVTVLVAGPLFLITILVVLGLVLGQETMTILRMIVYLGIPLATLAFGVYIDSVSKRSQTDASTEEYTDPRTAFVSGQVTEFDGDRQDDSGATAVDPVSAGGTPADDSPTEGYASADSTVGDDSDPAPDGGTVDGSPADERAGDGTDRWVASRERLAAYDAVSDYVDALRRPGRLLRQRPSATLWVTLPVALIWMFTRAGAVPADVLAAVRTLDAPVVEGSVLVFGVFAVVYEYENRRTAALEKAVPDFLDRLASINDAGMSVVESVEVLSNDDVGALTPELERTWRDIEWGADLETALHRLRERTESVMVTRAVALTTNAIAASGDVAPVMKIAADEARSTQQLRRERRQVMLTYMIVIYVSFFVFLGIVGALTTAFIPAIEGAQIGGGVPGGGSVPGVGGGGSPLSGIQNVNAGQYVVLFFHAGIVQSISSGLIAGQLGEGNVRDGVKHVTLMLVFSYVVFVFLV
jgi:flagellar protein FlaJ